MKSRTLAAAAVVLSLGLAACSPAAPSSPAPNPGASGSVDPAVAALNGVLKVGTEGTYSPFTFHDTTTNELTGYDVEVITAVADKLADKWGKPVIVVEGANVSHS